MAAATRSLSLLHQLVSAVVEGPRGALGQLKSCKNAPQTIDGLLHLKSLACDRGLVPVVGSPVSVSSGLDLYAKSADKLIFTRAPLG